MAEFSYSPSVNGGNILTQYIGHRRALAALSIFDKSPDRLIAYQTAAIQNEIRNTGAGVQNMMGKICSSVDSGFQMLSSHLKESNYKLGEINDSLNSMYAMLDDHLEMVLHTQRETNTLLKDLSRINVIPERQKDSYAYLEQGILFFNAAIAKGVDSHWFREAYSNLNEAMNLDKHNFITHFYLGKVIINSKEFLDTARSKQNLEAAEKYFAYSSELAMVLSLSNNATNQTILYNQYQFGNKITNKQAFYFEAASSLIAANKAAYLQMKFDAAANYCKQAMEFTPYWAEPVYRLAKALAAKGNGYEAAKTMEKAIKMDRYQVLKVLQDADLYTKVEIQNLIQKISTEAISEARFKYNQCLEVAHPNTSYGSTLNKINALISKNDFLSAKKAIDML